MQDMYRQYNLLTGYTGKLRFVSSVSNNINLYSFHTSLFQFNKKFEIFQTFFKKN